MSTAPTTPESAACRQWLSALEASERAQEKWIGRSDKISKRYMRATTSKFRRFSMLWSNTQTILPAVYARPPAPVVSRRFKDADPVGRAASEVLERALAYSVDKQDIDNTLRTAAFDYTLYSRGQVWERYVPTHGKPVTEKVKVLQVTTAAGLCYQDDEGKEYADGDVTPDDEGNFHAERSFRPVVYEESVTDYVNWRDFGHGPGRTWDEVPFVWRRAYLDRPTLVERFGKLIGNACALDWKAPGEERDSAASKAAVYEIWDKGSKKALWVSKGYKDGVMDERDDPLGLDGFFPCPRPLFGTLANDGLQPTPDFLQYQDQADEIDDLTARIADLQAGLKVRGFYSSDGKDNLDSLLKAGNNDLIPVAQWQSMKEAGGARGMVEWWPIDLVVAALKACIELRQQLINDVYQITGVSDILRGASDPNETAKAQGIKAQWGSLRVRDRQKEVARFARDVLRIKGEVIAETFSIDTLKAMTGVQLPMQAEKEQAAQAMQAAQMQAQAGGPPPQVPPEIVELMKKPTWEEVKALLEDNALRQFRIDIETDSTIEPDDQAEKQSTVELLSAIGGMIQQWGPAVEARPELAPMAAAMIKFGVRRFRAGRELEDVVEQAMDQVGQARPQQAQAGPAPAPTGKSPQELAIMGQEAQAAAMTAQTRAQTEQQRLGLEAAKLQQDGAFRAEELRLKAGDQRIKVDALNRDPKPQSVT